MKRSWARLSGEPALISGAVVAVLNLLALFGVYSLTAEQLAGVNTALVAILALVIRATVSPTHGKPFHMPVLHRPRSKPAA